MKKYTKLPKLPSSFTLMGTVWYVQFADLSAGNKLGCTDFRNHIITIDPNGPPDSIESTFLHELLHVLVFLMGLEKALKMDDEQEEILVNSLSNGLFAAIRAGILHV